LKSGVFETRVPLILGHGVDAFWCMIKLMLLTSACKYSYSFSQTKNKKLTFSRICKQAGADISPHVHCTRVYNCSLNKFNTI